MILQKMIKAAFDDLFEDHSKVCKYNRCHKYTQMYLNKKPLESKVTREFKRMNEEANDYGPGCIIPVTIDQD